jgi:hypothetical protein
MQAYRVCLHCQFACAARGWHGGGDGGGCSGRVRLTWDLHVVDGKVTAQSSPQRGRGIRWNNYCELAGFIG